MIKRILIATTFAIFLLLNTANIFFVNSWTGSCDPRDGLQNHGCDPNLICRPVNSWIGSCEQPTAGEIFGKVIPPEPLKNLLATDPTGTGAISNFLSRLVTLIFSIATIALIFMILWGAFEWLTSGGDKEKLSSAQKRIISALVGIALFAVAFAIIQVLGTFTGFKFFEGQI